MPSMKNLAFLLLLSGLLMWSCKPNPASEYGAFAQLAQQRLLLPNGWSLTPAGEQMPLGHLPLNMKKVPGMDQLVVTNNGVKTHSIMLVDLSTRQILDEAEVPSAWVGLDISPDGKTVYASGGHQNCVWVFAIEQGKLQKQDSIYIAKPWPSDTIAIAGLTLANQGKSLFVLGRENGKLYEVDLATKKAQEKVDLGKVVYTCLTGALGNKIYLSVWADKSVCVYDVAAGAITATIPVGGHPNDMTLSADGQRLFVACADDNAVSVIDVPSAKVTETLYGALYPDAPTGSTTNGVALSQDGTRLYMANADNNCLAVFDVSEPGESRSLGFIPTGWYPSVVRLWGDKILVANGKGDRSYANKKGPNPYMQRTDSTEYIAWMITGSLSLIDKPEAEELESYSKMVYDNTPYNKEKEKQAHTQANNPIPMKVGDPSPIRYVFYIIKENRTYDQVFGDIAEGNGDPSICIFPDSVTPNQHALARSFVLLDNFYVDAEVSADGHNWSMGAYATDYVEKTWPSVYGGKGGHYTFEGSHPPAYPRDGYLFDFCQKAGVGYRSYGQFVYQGKSKYPALAGHIDPQFPSYDLSIRDVYRFEKWREDFDSLLALNAVPQFNVIRLGNDHTAGARPGSLTPIAMVADNDLAVGKLVEHLSNSPIWKESAIFVLEDDAQNGSDHVDAHRSIALVVSPYTKRNHVESTMYSTSAMLRTIELILGLPPMSQYDAAATPMFACFMETPDLTPFKALANRVNLEERNKDLGEISRISSELDLAQEDRIPDILFNQIIWKTVRGVDSEMPAPRRSAFVRLAEEVEEEEESEQK